MTGFDPIFSITGYHLMLRYNGVRYNGIDFVIYRTFGIRSTPENWYTLKKSTPYLTKKSALKVSTPPKTSTLQLGIQLTSLYSPFPYSHTI